MTEEAVSETPRQWEVRHYDDDLGRIITERTALDGSGDKRYRGSAIFTGQNRPIPFEFDILAQSRAEAFSLFDRSAKEAADQVAADLRKRLIIPGSPKVSDFLKERRQRMFGKAEAGNGGGKRR